VAVLTVSDRCARGERSDESGAAIVAWCAARGDSVVEHALVPDETSCIVPRLLEWADSGQVDAILTTGGTGFTQRDVTPEATRAVMEREAPGLPGAILAHGLAETPYALLSRGLAGIRAETLIVNLPGSTGGVRDGLSVLEGRIDHAVKLLRGEVTGHRQSGDSRGSVGSSE